MPNRLSTRPAKLPRDDNQRSKKELLKELRMLRRQYVNLKILKYEHDKALAALKESQEKYRRIVESASDIIYRTDERGYFTYANHAAVRIIGYPIKEILGRNYMELLRPDYRKKAYRHYTMQTEQRIPSTYFEFPAVSKEGETVWLGQNVQLIMQGKRIVELQAVARDITEVKRAEEERARLEVQLRQSQKMESIGRLAGGIAHDFNNILGIILAHVSLLERSDLPAEQKSSSIEALNRTVGRAKGMVGELLTLARKSEPSLEYLDVEKAIREFAPVIEGTFPRSISLSIRCTRGLPGIDADPNQFHQLLLNLFVNARDAMPNGGKIEVTTEQYFGESVRMIFREAEETPYVGIRVKDTGIGMDESTRVRIFDPFFSTKPQGKGTGLGLAVAYGIIKSHRGFVDVESNPGKGSTFYLFFPKGVRTPRAAAPVRKQATTPGGNETILFVEDEDLLREVISKILREKGYTVLEAVDGIGAVDVFMKNHKKIDLVLSDFGLPKLGGWEACITMKEIKPEVRVILASGFIEPAVRNEMAIAGITTFVQKPYVPDEVLQNIRELMKKG